MDADRFIIPLMTYAVIADGGVTAALWGMLFIGTLFSDRVQDKKALEAERSHSSPYEMDWEFTYQKGRDEFYCTYTQCGICKLAKQEHMERFLPCMCQMDFATYEMVGAKLERTKTLANGDECCKKKWYHKLTYPENTQAQIAEKTVRKITNDHIAGFHKTD